MARAEWKVLALAGLAVCSVPVEESSSRVPVSSPPAQATRAEPKQPPQPESVLDAGRVVDDTRIRVDGAHAALTAGDLVAARDLARKAIEALLALDELAANADWIKLLDSAGLAAWEARDARAARSAWEAVHQARSSTLGPDHYDLLMSQQRLARALSVMGDLAAARALEERVLEACERIFHEKHPLILRAQLNLAITLRAMGDLSGARALQEQVLEEFELTLHRDDPDLILAQGNLAATLAEMGELESARSLFECVLEARERLLAEDDPYLLRARLNLAAAMAETGDLTSARALLESVLEGDERTLPEDHPDLLRTRGNLAITLYSMGDLAGARAHQARVLEAQVGTLPEDHPELLATRANIARTMVAMDDLAGARSQFGGLVSGMRRRALAALALSPREARAAVEINSMQLSAALFLSKGAESPDQSAMFELVETRRLIGTSPARAARLVAEEGRLTALAREAADARARLNDLTAAAAQQRSSKDEFGAELERLSSLRDRAERTIRSALSERGIVVDAISTKQLERALPERSAAVGYLRYLSWGEGETTPRSEGQRERILAHVLPYHGELMRVELGLASEIEHAVSAWRTALGRPLTTRGGSLNSPAGDSEAEIATGQAVRRLLLDRLLELTGEGTCTLFVCPDDLAFLVPLDALPMEGQRVGDRYRIVLEPSFAPLLQPPAPLGNEPSLVALGGIDFEADIETAALAAARGSPLGDIQVLNESAARFGELPGSHQEIRAVAALFESAFGRQALVLESSGATKLALAEHAPRARYLHLATHGWFAPEAVKSILDEPPASGGAWQRMGIEERITGFAPMTLCGLALAGANLGPDSLGRVPGILTAEEMCSLDLSNCELAVLSACETNVGIRRAGQGIQSLQAALYAAGARTSITSLWKVDDAATRKLMELFYTYLWIEKLPKAEALWRAKTDLRTAGHPVRDWAGWVLCGAVE